jgi:ABC-type multidrug transport system permease subunit
MIPALAEFMTQPIVDTAMGSITPFTLYTGLVLSILIAGSKQNLINWTYAASQTTVTTVLFVGIIMLGFLTAGDIVAAEMMGTDPWIINYLVDLAHNPPGLEDFIKSGVNESFMNNSTILE